MNAPDLITNGTNELARSCNCACDKHERSQAAGPCMHGGKHAHSRHSSPAGHQLRLRTCLFIAASIKLVDRPSEDAHYSISNSARLFVLLMVVEQSKQPLAFALLPARGRGAATSHPAHPRGRPAARATSFVWLPCLRWVVLVLDCWVARGRLVWIANSQNPSLTVPHQPVQLSRTMQLRSSDELAADKHTNSIFCKLWFVL